MALIEDDDEWVRRLERRVARMIKDEKQAGWVGFVRGRLMPSGWFFKRGRPQVVLVYHVKMLNEADVPWIEGWYETKEEATELLSNQFVWVGIIYDLEWVSTPDAIEVWRTTLGSGDEEPWT